MAIFTRSTFSFVLAALIASTATAQTSINFANCALDEDARTTSGTFSSNQNGSQRRTYGNLCAGTSDSGGSNSDISSRNGHPFVTLCELIDNYDNIKALMSTGTSPHTIFAPTDAAFSKITGLTARVDERRLLELHILPQARLARDLRCGQTYRTLNTQQDRRNNQRVKTRCINAARAQMLGPGNTVNGLRPTIGNPNNIFVVDQFAAQNNFVLVDNLAGNDDEDMTFGQDVISCNGVIHVVDEVLLPGGQNAFAYNQYSGVLPGPPAQYYGTPNTPGYYGNGLPGMSRPPVGTKGYYGPPYPPGPYPPPPYSYYGGKGAKGYRRRRPPPAYNPSIYYNGGPPFRKLKDEDADEMFMSDAEFFGTNAAGDKTEQDTSSRKRRLEALVEPDGEVKV